MAKNVSDIIGIAHMLKTVNARSKIEVKTERIGRKARQMRNGYTNAQIKQRQQLRNHIRTKHK